MINDIIQGKTIWITGASSGIGYELAKTLAENKNFVFVSARSSEKLEKLKELYPDNIHPVVLDVTNEASLEDAKLHLDDETDHLDMVVLCAGTCEYDDGLKLPSDMFERLTQTNYLGAVNCVRIANPLLRKSNGRGLIVGISSLASVVPFPRAAAYGASKVALEYFLQSAAIDLQYDDIDVTIVRPGFVDTPLTQRNDFDMPFLMKSEEAVKCITAAMVSRQRIVEFPKKLAWSLKLMGASPRLWLKNFAPKFRKPQVL